MKRFSCWDGMIELELTSAAPENTMAAIAVENIPVLYSKKKNDLTYQFTVQQKSYSKLCRIINLRGDHLEIIQRKGLFWYLIAFRYRPVLLLAFIFLTAISTFLPTRILFVSVEGNDGIPAQHILAAAEKCGVEFGTSRKLVRSEKVKNALIAAVPELQWVGINTSGCNATISVRERTVEKNQNKEYQVSNLIADLDGYILSTNITAGTGCVYPGNSVTEGEILISGYTDCGICLQATRAEGEIFAQTKRNLSSVMPANYSMAERMEKKAFCVSLLFGKKRINLWKDSRILTTLCDRMYEEYYVSLPGGFQLPIAICVDRYRFYEIQESLETEQFAFKQLQHFSDDYLNRQMLSGQIVTKQQQFFSEDDLYLLNSKYVCTEMIGKEQREQIGVLNGKRN